MTKFGMNFVGSVATVAAVMAVVLGMRASGGEAIVAGMVLEAAMFGAVMTAIALGVTLAMEKTAANTLTFAVASGGAFAGMIGFLVLPHSLLNPLGLLYPAAIGFASGLAGSLLARLGSLTLDLKAGRTTWKELLAKANRVMDRIASRLPSRENAVAFIAAVTSFVLLILAVNVIGGREPEAYLHDIMFVVIMSSMVVGSSLVFVHLIGRTAKDWRVLAALTAGLPAMAFFCLFLSMGASAANCLFVVLVIGAFCALPGIVGSFAARLVRSSSEPPIDGIVA